MARQLLDLLTQSNWLDLPGNAVPTSQNKRMACRVTSSDGDLATDEVVADTPASDSHVSVFVNGLNRTVGDGVSTGVDCYFSSDGGTTPRAIADIAAGDTCHWNGSNAGFELTASDIIEFDYDIQAAGAGGGGGAGAVSAEIITSGQIDLYVRDVDGDDANPGTSSLPLKTIVEARARIPYIIQHKVVIHVGVHAGAGYELPTFGPHLLRQDIGIIGDGAGVGDGQTEIIASTAALAGTTQAYIETSGLSTTEYSGYGELYSATIEILSGAAIGERRTIAYNTADRIYPLIPFYNTVAPGDLYRITVPAVQCLLPAMGTAGARHNVLNVGDDYIWLIEHRGNKIVFADLELVTANSYFIATNSTVAFYNVLVTEKFNFSGLNSVLLSGADSGAYDAIGDGAQVPVDLFGAPNKYAWYGLCFGSRWDHRDSEGSVAGSNMIFSGFVAAGDLYYTGDVTVYLYAVSSHGNAIRVANRANLYISCFAGLFGTASFGIIRIGSVAAARGIYAYDDAKVSVSSAVTNGILIRSAYDVLISEGKDSSIKITNYVADGIELECVNGVAPENYAALRSGTDGFIRLIGSELPTAVGDTQGFHLGSTGRFRDLSEITSGSQFIDAVHGRIVRD